MGKYGLLGYIGNILDRDRCIRLYGCSDNIWKYFKKSSNFGVRIIKIKPQINAKQYRKILRKNYTTLYHRDKFKISLASRYGMRKIIIFALLIFCLVYCPKEEAEVIKTCTFTDIMNSNMTIIFSKCFP